jgi:hypothetical protein
MTISEKVAYLKGLADGLDLDKEATKESKLLVAIIDVLEEVGYSIEDIEEAYELLNEGLDAVSEDLEDVEDILFCDEDECDCECNCDGDCGDDDFFEIECPNCNENLVIDEGVLEAGQIVCPNCGDAFALDLVDEDEEDEDE